MKYVAISCNYYARNRSVLIFFVSYCILSIKNLTNYSSVIQTQTSFHYYSWIKILASKIWKYNAIIGHIFKVQCLNKIKIESTNALVDYLFNKKKLKVECYKKPKSKVRRYFLHLAPTYERNRTFFYYYYFFLFITTSYFHCVLLQHCTLKNLPNESNVIQIQRKLQCYMLIGFSE